MNGLAVGMAVSLVGFRKGLADGVLVGATDGTAAGPKADLEEVGISVASAVESTETRNVGFDEGDDERMVGSGDGCDNEKS